MGVGALGCACCLPLPGLRRPQGLRGTGRRSRQRGGLGLSPGRASLCRPWLPARAGAGEGGWRPAEGENTERARGPSGQCGARGGGRREKLVGDGKCSDSITMSGK